MWPELFHIGSLTISPYGILVATGFLVGLWMAGYIASRYEKIDTKTIWDFGITTVLAALIGAKILLIFTDPYFYQHPSHIFSMAFVRSAGVFYGGFILALVWAGWYFHRYHLPGWKIADAFGVAIPLGHTFGRIGCFTAGCCHGSPTDFFWGITFTNPNCMVENGYLNTPLNPTQLLEAGANFILFLVLFFRYRKKSFDGQMILIYIMSYATIRFLIEFLRGDTRGWVIPGVLSTSQFIALVIFPIALGLYFWRRKKGRQEA